MTLHRKNMKLKVYVLCLTKNCSKTLRHLYNKCILYLLRHNFQNRYFSKLHCNLKINTIMLKLECSTWWQTWGWIRRSFTFQRRFTHDMINHTYFQLKSLILLVIVRVYPFGFFVSDLPEKSFQSKYICLYIKT